MRTITIDVINEKALNLLQDLEMLQLIRLHDMGKHQTATTANWASKYKGAMSRQSLNDIDEQLNELRDEWE